MPDNQLELTISITETDAGLQSQVLLPADGLTSLPTEFNLPLDADAMRDIRWYLEDYIKWPTGPDVQRAERVERRLEDWGRALRNAVFESREAISIWQQFRSDDEHENKLVTIASSEPDALRLPWELLADEEGHVFSLGISLRRRLPKTQRVQQPTFAPPVRILMVVARPKEAGFIDPRESPQALLDATETLRAGDDSVVVEFLYPPTLEALTDRLNDSNQPAVHVLHFDGHGIYRQNTGLGYLAFEDSSGDLDLVDGAGWARFSPTRRCHW